MEPVLTPVIWLEEYVVDQVLATVPHLVHQTVCHYGMGAMATSGTLQKCDLCIRAQESAHLFGKRVESFGLGSPVLDGLKGTVGGFVNDRREVKLEDGRTVVFKPENLRLIDESGKPLKPSRRITKLVDIQDRMGYVALHELMETQRADMATELLEKYGARVDLPNWEGKSPAQNALIRGVGMVSPVANLVNMAAMKQGRDCYVCKRKTKENGNPLMACSKCKSIRYCSSACQKEDWDRHKPDCKKIQKTMVGTVTIKPEQLDTRMHHATLNNASRNTNPSNTIRRPRGVRVDEEFDIKVQANSNQFDMLIYDKTRDCSFSLPPQAEGFDRLFQRVKVETRTNGTKAYFKASVNAAGYLVVKLGETTLKGW